MILLTMPLCVYGSADELIVSGTSMMPVLKPGQTIVYSPYKNPTQRGDIVVVQIEGRKRFIVKRIMGLPGDRLEVLKSTSDACQIKVNDKVLKNSLNKAYYFRGNPCKLLSLYVKDYAGKIPLLSYLVLGEKVSGTLDASSFGLIEKKQILGKVALK